MKYLYEDINLGNTNNCFNHKKVIDIKVNSFLNSLKIKDNDIHTIKIDEYTHVNDLHVILQIFYKG